MSKPKKKVPLTIYEIILEIFALMGILVFAALMFFQYPMLKEKIPTHFNFSGQPDAWGNKSSMIYLSTVVLVLYLGLTVLNRFPYIFNYPVEITTKNADRQYRMARTLLSFLKLGMIILFLTILYTSIQIAKGINAHLGGGYMVVMVLVLLVLPLVIYLVISIQNK
jgi:uncharacterized membrane protein